MKILSVKLALSWYNSKFKQFCVCVWVGGYFFKSDRKQLICPTWTPHGVRALRAPALQRSLPHRLQSPNSLICSQGLDGSTPLQLGTLFSDLRAYPPPYTHILLKGCVVTLFLEIGPVFKIVTSAKFYSSSFQFRNNSCFR